MLELRRPGHVVRVGHRGAPALAPENTLRSFELAVAHGAEIVEIDVLAHEGRLVLAHSRRELPRALPTLDEGLERLAALGVAVQVDVKAHGHEARIVDAVRAHGLLEHAFVSTSSVASLRRFAAAEPGLPRSLTYPEDRLGLTGRAATRPLVGVGLAALRRALPRRLPGLLRRAGAAAATLNHRVVTPAAVAACHREGAAVYVWTVDDPALVEPLVAAGADGIITNNPEIFRLLPSAT